MVFRDADSTQLEMLSAGVLLIAGTIGAARLLKSGKYRSGLSSWLFYAGAIGLLIYSTTIHLILALLMIPLILFVGSLGNLAHGIAARKTMEVDSDRAASIERELAAGRRTERFFLFLRPFYVTGKLGVANPRKSSLVLSPAYYAPDVVDWETLFAEQVERFGRFVALGRPEEAVGAGRISTSEREWREKFIRLATLADAIFVIPSNRAGTRFEIDWLRDRGWLNKCVFVWPGAFDSVAAQYGENGAEILRGVGAARLAEAGAAGGAMYTLDGDERVDLLIAPLPIAQPQRMFSALSKVLSVVRTDGLSYFERSLALCQSFIDALPPPAEQVDEVEPEEEQEEPAVELTGLACDACGRILDDGFVCATCEGEAAR